ncbi:MAG: DUF2845 domain-containing protein [Deltaproteobacteria bacterium]
MKHSVLIAAIFVPFFAPDAEAGLRCGSDVVSLGSSTYQVKVRCGAPYHVDTTVEARTTRRFVPRIGYVENRVTVPVERWTYVRSENELVRTLVFENGQLISVKTEGRPPDGEGSLEQCKRAIHSTGDTLAEVLLRCGPPTDARRWYEEVAVGNRNFERRELVPHERWIYDLGDNRLLRVLTFERGRLVRQESAR